MGPLKPVASSSAEGGFLAFDRLPHRLKDEIDPWGADRLSAAHLSLMRNLKDALDPSGRLSPGRFVGGL